MKVKTYLLTGIMALMLSFLIGCNEEGILTPNQEGAQYVYDFNSSGCLNELFENWPNLSKQGQKYERVEIFTSNNEVRFTHYNTVLNCEAEIKIEVNIKGDTIFISEKDTAAMSARCICPYRLSYCTVLEKDGIYNIKINDEEPFAFDFKLNNYNDTTIFLRPYEGPDFYEILPIWDFNGHNINFTVTDSKGNDLLNPEYSGNILKNNVTITYDNQTFKSNDIELRLYLPEPLAIRKSYNQNLKKHLLTFGEFTPIDNLKNETFTIDWGDGTKDVVKFDLYMEWPNIYTPQIYKKLYLNEKEVAIENYGFTINLIK